MAVLRRLAALAVVVMIAVLARGNHSDAAGTSSEPLTNHRRESASGTACGENAQTAESCADPHYRQR